MAASRVLPADPPPASTRGTIAAGASRRGAMLLLAITTSLASAAASSAAPRAVLSETAFDFGMIAPREVLEHRFVIRNEGDAPLVLGETRLFEEIALARAERDTIAPGAESAVEVVIRPVEPGPFHTKIVLASNDPSQPQLAFILAASVAPWIEWDRTVSPIGPVRPGEKDVLLTALRLRKEAGLSARGPFSSRPFVIAELRTTADPGALVLAVSIAPDAPSGPFSAEVGLPIARAPDGSAVAWRDTIRYAVEGVVVGNWLVTPNPFDAIMTPYSWTEAPQIDCRRSGKSPARVLSATTTVPEHVVRLETVEAGRAYRIRLAPVGPWKPGSWKGEVRITTDDPAQKTIVVPARVIVGEARAAR